MPIYEYRCTDCTSDFEALVRSMTSTDTVRCPQCGSSHVKKAISLVGATAGAKTTAGGAAGASCGPVG